MLFSLLEIAVYKYTFNHQDDNPIVDIKYLE